MRSRRQQEKKPSVRDVARRAGVGTSTVSRTLNDHPSVSAKARQSVLNAIRELGYTPNVSARSLRTGQAHAASVLLPMIGPQFYERLLESIQLPLAREDLDTALFPIVGGIRLRRYRDPGALPYYADGLIIASLDPERLFEGARPPFDKPIVLVDTHHPSYHSVYFDNLEAGRLAARHALELGEPIALLDVEEQSGVFESPVFGERRKGVLQELGRNGVAPRQHLRLPISIESGREGGQLLSWPEGEELTVIASCDELALGALRQFEEGGYAVGKQVRVIGFDDHLSAAERGLTTVAQPVEEMGERAGELLLAAMAGVLDSIQQVSFPPRLVVRSSTRSN